MAANVITAVIPKLLAQGLLALRHNTVTPRLVASLTTAIAGVKGSTIDVPIPSAITAVDVVPANVAPAAGALQPFTMPVALTNWKEAAFDLTDNEYEQAMDGIIPMQASEAVKSICNAVDDSILILYKKFFGFQGTPGTTPFGAGVGVADATGIRKVLNKQLAPLDNRNILVNPDAEAAALGLQEFANMNFSGSVDAMREGMLNRKLGFDWWMNQRMPFHTTTAIGAGAMTVNGVNNPAAPGAQQTLSIAKAAGASWVAVEGDLITIVHGGGIGPRQYVISTGVTIVQGANTTVNISPALPAATAGGEAITGVGQVGATVIAAQNLAFHRDAIAFANRPLAPAPEGLGELSLSQVDPISGLALRIEVKREHKRTRWSYDFLWGVAVVRPELGARLLG